MRYNPVAACLALVVGVTAIRSQHDMIEKALLKRQSYEVFQYPEPPSYNFSMPVDHFTSSDTRTYDNRYFVNDTYYKAGGPVILYDFGESGISPRVASALVEFNGSLSAPIQLAKRLNGLVIGWEHRYYGFSQPVPITVELTDASYPYSGAGPTEGASGYRYHTVEQALEDLVYFANRFNSTKLDLNDNVPDTANLDPYHTPWILVGGSYPGVRAAWGRIRNPEIFYAAWASSAPVEARLDGSIYYNPIYRSMPSNCTADIQAAVAYLDKELQGNLAYTLKAGVYLAPINATGGPMDLSSITYWDEYSTGNNMLNAIAGSFQSYGPGNTDQIFCDYMNTFDAETFYSTAASTSSDALTFWDGVFRGRVTENRPDGIAAAFSDDGGQAAFIAYQFATYWSTVELSKFQATIGGRYDGYDRDDVDSHAWIWQTISQMGFMQGSNSSSKMNLGSKYANVTAVHENVNQYFPDYSASDLPAEINTTGPLSFGGWQMTPSNVMFTNGELDPWRSFSVQSQEQVDGGAPERKTTQSVPACNKPPSGMDVFGLVYGGAVHCEDLAVRSYKQGSEDPTDPMYQGLDLFESAWKTWSPCFNQSRDDIRNGKGVDGEGNGADGNKENSASSNVGSFGLVSMVVMLLSVLNNVL